MGREHFWRKPQLRRLHGVYLKELLKKKKRAGGWISSLDRTVWVASVSLCNRDEMARHLYRHTGGNSKRESMCVCFLMWCRTLYRRTVSCMCGKASVPSQKSGEKKTKMELLSGPRPRPLSAETKHLLKHWTFLQFHFHFTWFQLLTLTLSWFKKGRAAHPVKTFCVFSVSYASWFFATSKIIHLLQFKLFLMIFKCIYVSFFTLTIC